MKNAQILPPKMMAIFAAKARNGEFSNRVPNSDIYEFYQGNQVVCLIGIDPPCTGHVRKVSTEEMARLKASTLPSADCGGVK